MLCDLCKGAHHVFGIIRPCNKNGIVINISSGFHASTFDFNGLTEAVFLAHQRCIRFEIAPSGPNMLKLFFHKRHKRDGQMHERHPTLDYALELHRNKWGDE